MPLLKNTPIIYISVDTTAVRLVIYISDNTIALRSHISMMILLLKNHTSFESQMILLLWEVPYDAYLWWYIDCRN